MSASRLLVVADPKLLPALSAGLREGGKLEVTGLPYAEMLPLMTAAETADAILLFYGTPARPLAQALELLAKPVRDRGGRVIAVLQKDTASQRDECFRSGASDVLFMPLAKDLFVQRVLDSVELAHPGEQSCELSVTVTREGHEPLPLEGAQVSYAGVRGGGLAAARGELVTVSFDGGGGPFSAFALVCSADDKASVLRLAGLNPDEDGRLRALLKERGIMLPPPGATKTPPKPPPAILRPVAVPEGAAADSVPAPRIDPALVATPAPSASNLQGAPFMAAPGIAPLGPPPGMRSVPQGGPPPGFADRPHIRPHVAKGPRTGTPPGVGAVAPATSPSQPAIAPVPTPSTPVAPVPPAAAPAAAPPADAPQAATPAVAPDGSTPTAPADAAPADAQAKPAEAPASPAAEGAPVVPPAPADAPAALPADGAPAAAPAPQAPLDDKGAPATPAAPGPLGGADAAGLLGLFDEGAAQAAAPTEAAPPAPTGPLWPGPVDVEQCKAVTALMYKDRAVPPTTPPDYASAARKVVLGLSSVEREALEKSGPDSHLYEALHARMAMAVANAAATRLFASQPPAVVDPPSLTAMVHLADGAAKRLQAEADKAITTVQVEALQMITAASAALSREQLTLKEAADRLRGIAAAPRLGAGALDPDMQVPGQGAAKPALRKDAKEEKKEVRAELRDFRDLEDVPKAEKTKRRLYVALGVFVLSLANALWFSHPGAKTASQTMVEKAGTGVLQVSLAGKTALVTVTSAWSSIERRREALRQLCDMLHSVGVSKAALVVEGGGVIGQIDVDANCNPLGLPGGKGPAAPQAVPLPPVPTPAPPPPAPEATKQ